MKSDHGRWPLSTVRLHGPTSMVWFPKKNLFTKPLGPSLGVNQMWTRRSDHAPKDECVDFFLKKYAQKMQFWKKIKTIKFDLSLVFSCLHLLFPKTKIHLKCRITTWALFFFSYSTSFTSPTAKPVGPCQWILMYVFWGPHTPWSL